MPDRRLSRAILSRLPASQGLGVDLLGSPEYFAVFGFVNTPSLACDRRSPRNVVLILPAKQHTEAARHDRQSFDPHENHPDRWLSLVRDDCAGAALTSTMCSRAPLIPDQLRRRFWPQRSRYPATAPASRLRSASSWPPCARLKAATNGPRKARVFAGRHRSPARAPLRWCSVRVSTMVVRGNSGSEKGSTWPQ